MIEAKKSVLIIGINFFPEPTGIGKYTAEFAFGLADKGYDVDVITSVPYYPQWKVYDGYANKWYVKETVNNVAITRCPVYVPGSLSGAKRMLQDFSFFTSGLGTLLRRMFFRKKYDLVFVASPSFLSGFLGLFYKFFFRKTLFVYHIQDLQVDAAEELKMINNGTLLRLLKWAEGLVLKGADIVSTISTGMMKRILSKPVKIKKTYLFPNWVDYNKIFKKEPDTSKLAGLGLPLDKKLILYSGAVGEKQGLEIVLGAAKKAMVAIPNVCFIISGSGPYAGTLKEKAKNDGLTNLRFIDLQPIDVFNELLNLAFIHLVIQKDKASDLLLPSKLTNILAVGGLAIVTASPDTTLYEIVFENRLGYVIPPDNPVAFFEALHKICNDSSIVENLKLNAANYAARFLDKEIIINSFLSEINFERRYERDSVLV